jgi:hypothetical protein
MMMQHEHCTAQAETRAVKLFLWSVAFVLLMERMQLRHAGYLQYDMLGLSAWNVV